MENKNNSRRAFIKKSSLAMLAGFASNNFFEINDFKKKGKYIGVQLYSVREDMKNDPLDTLKKVREMGYNYVEHANYINRKFYGWSASEFKKILDDLGFKMFSGHTVLGKNQWDESAKDFKDTWKQTVEDAAICGQKFVISPWLDHSYFVSTDEMKKAMDTLNKAGELCHKSGMQFGYHNHDFEYTTKVGDRLIYDILLQDTDPKLVVQQMDIGNMKTGKADAMDWIKKYPGRFPLFHVKDTTPDLKESAVLGTGVVDLKTVLANGKLSGCKYFVIEQEAYQGKQPLDCIKEDLEWLKKVKL